MENYPRTEDEWEIIPEPYHEEDPQPYFSSTQPCVVGAWLDLNLSVHDDYYTTDHGGSLFPSKFHHQGQQTRAEIPSPEEVVNSSSSSSSTEDEFPSDDDEVDSSNKKLVLTQIGKKLRDLSTVIASNLYTHLKFREKFWSIALKVSLVSATAVSLIYARVIWQQNRAIQESRNRLILLLRERDRKISQLLIRITQLNEIVSGRRRIPVVVLQSV